MGKVVILYLPKDIIEISLTPTLWQGILSVLPEDILDDLCHGVTHAGRVALTSQNEKIPVTLVLEDCHE